MSHLNEAIGTHAGQRPADEQFRALFEAAGRVMRYHADRANSAAASLLPVAAVLHQVQMPVSHPVHH